MHNFIDLYGFISDLITKDDAKDDAVFHIDDDRYANVFIDSDQNIQVNIYDSADLDEQIDGGGVCILNGFDDDDDLDTRSASYILNHGTPEDICQLITDKALFVWELVNTYQ